MKLTKRRVTVAVVVVVCLLAGFRLIFTKPYIRFAEFRVTKNGQRVAVFRMVNPSCFLHFYTGTSDGGPYQHLRFHSKGSGGIAVANPPPVVIQELRPRSEIAFEAVARKERFAIGAFICSATEKARYDRKKMRQQQGRLPSQFMMFLDECMDWRDQLLHDPHDDRLTWSDYTPVPPKADR